MSEHAALTASAALAAATNAVALLISCRLSASRHALPADEAARDAELGGIAALRGEDAEIAGDGERAVEARIETDAVAEEAGAAGHRLVLDERRRHALVAGRALELLRRLLLRGGDRRVRDAYAVALAGLLVGAARLRRRAGVGRRRRRSAR